MRVCACGCGRSLEGRRPEARYATDKCRARHWKLRTGYGRADQQKGVRTAEAPRSGPSGLQVSYRKAVKRVAELLAVNGWVQRRDAEHVATLTLRAALPDRQRERLEEQS